MRQAVTCAALLVLCAAAVAVRGFGLSASEQAALHAVQQHTWDQAYFKAVHPAIAYLALKQLTPRARAAVQALVPDLPAEAGWADRITFTEPKQTWSSPLHFINLPTGACAYSRARDCKSNTGEANVCVDGAIQNYTARLANTQLPAAQRAEALKFVTHFVGDIHQPLHVANGADWGGNKLTGSFLAQAPSNLHAVWDAAIAQKRVTDDFAGDALKWADATMARVKAADRKGWAKCKRAHPHGACSDEWANESAQLACEYGYTLADGTRKTPVPATGFALDTEWYARNVHIVDRQVVKAAVRLAAVINTVFANGLTTTAPAKAPAKALASPLPPRNARNTAPIRKTGRN